MHYKIAAGWTFFVTVFDEKWNKMKLKQFFIVKYGGGSEWTREVLKETFFKMFPFGIFQNFISEFWSFILTHEGIWFYVIVNMLYTMSVTVFSIMLEVFYFILYGLISNGNKLSFWEFCCLPYWKSLTLEWVSPSGIAMTM